jgi:hypothetical protein
MIDYGPLTQLIGKWEGTKGVDVSPEEIGEEVNQYKEELIFEGVGEVSNAEKQNLVALFYHQKVIRISDNKLIHHETGHYSWDSENETIMKSFSIPRGIAVCAGGTLTNKQNQLALTVNAASDNDNWKIVQSPFMQQNALTKNYLFNLVLEDGKLIYSQTMTLDIFSKSFNHTDKNTLLKVGAVS